MKRTLSFFLSAVLLLGVFSFITILSDTPANATDIMPELYGDISFANGEAVDLKGNFAFTNYGADISVQEFIYNGKTISAPALNVTEKGQSMKVVFDKISKREDQIDLIKDGFVVEAIFVNRVQGGTQGIVCGTQYGGWGLASSGGKPYFLVHNGSGWSSAYAKETSPVDSLIHMVGVLDPENKEVRIYINGELNATTAFNGTFFPADKDNFNIFYLGADPNTNGEGKDYQMTDFSILTTKFYLGSASDTQVAKLFEDSLEIGTDEPEPDPEPSVVFDSDNIVLSFAALSDIHQNGDPNSSPAQKFISAMNQLKKYNIDLVLAAGDLTDGASVKEIQQFKDTYESVLKGTPLFYALGNHDGQSGNTADRFYNNFGKSYFDIDIDTDAIKKGNRYAVVNGYPFIAVEVFSYYNANGNASYSKATIDWLEETLEIAAADFPGKPIFLTTHAMIYDTVYGSTLPSTGTNWYSTDLTDTLKKFPQVVTFSGHVHHPLNDERSIMQTDFTSLGCGSVRYMAIESGYMQTGSTTVPKDANDYSQGLVVQVDKNNNVRFTRMDFFNESTIKEPWEIPAPAADRSHLKVYPKNRSAATTAPDFGDNELDVKLTNVGAMFNAQAQFNSATDDDLVHHYIVNVYENDSAVPVKTIKYLSDFYLVPKVNLMKSDYSIPLGTLQKGTNYKITVTAVDSWGKVSTAIEKSFLTEGTRPVEDETELPEYYAHLKFEDGKISDLMNRLKFTINGATIENGTFKYGNKTFDAVSFNVLEAGQNAFCEFSEIKNREELINFMGNGFSIEAFYINRAPASTQGIACATQDGGWGLATADGTPYFVASTGQYVSSYAPEKAPTDELTHVLAVYDTIKSEIRFYVDGELKTTTPFTGIFKPGSGDSYKGFHLGADIGEDGTASDFLMSDFSLLDLKIYAKPLNNIQATKAYEALLETFIDDEDPSEDTSDPSEDDTPPQTGQMLGFMFALVIAALSTMFFVMKKRRHNS